LSEDEWKKARELFRGLKELPPDDRAFLATKYDRPTIRKGNTKVHPSDKMVAKELGMETKEYTSQRRRIQKKLQLIMMEHE